MLKTSPVFAFLLLLVVLCAPIAPAFAEPGPSLLGVNSQTVATPVAAPALGVPAAPRAEQPAEQGSWIGKFGKGFVDGVLNALPNMWKAIKENPLMTVGMVAGMVVLAVAAPAVAAVAGIALTVGTIGYAAYQSGGDPTKLGQVVGETAFWTAAGLGIAKGVTAVRAATAGRTAVAAEGIVAEVNAAKNAGTLTAAETTAAKNASTLTAAETTAANAGKVTAAETTAATNAGRTTAAEGVAAETTVANATTADRSLPVVNNALCFVAGTRVLTANGERAIETLSVGDEVLTWSPVSRHAARSLALGLALALVQPSAAAVVSDADPVARPAPSFSSGFAAYDADGAARGVRPAAQLSRGQLVRVDSRLWRITRGAALDHPAIDVEPTDLAVAHVARLFRRSSPAVHELTARHADGRETRVTGTAEHPFYVPSRQAWVQLAALLPGTDVATASGGVARVTANERRDAPQQVFNFEVPGSHNYYVSDAGDAPALLAHNDCYGDRAIKAAETFRASIAADPAAASIKPVTTSVDVTKRRILELLRDGEHQPHLASQNGTELKNVFTGAEKAAKDYRAMAGEVRATNPKLAAEIEVEATRLENLVAGGRTRASALEGAARPATNQGLLEQQAKALDDALVQERKIPVQGSEPTVRAAVIDEQGRTFVGHSNKGTARDISSFSQPELQALKPKIEQFQLGLIQGEQKAIAAMSQEQQIAFLKFTRNLEIKNNPLLNGRINAKADLANLDATLKANPALIQEQLAARFAALDKLPVQSRMEQYANAFGGSRLSPNNPGNCAEWSAIEKALTERPPPLPVPPGKGLTITARDSLGVYKPCCAYCTFVMKELGIQVVR